MSLEYPDTAGPAEFGRIFQDPDLPESCLKLIESGNFNFRTLEGAARDDIILKTLTELDQPLPVSGPSRLPRWEAGWGENLELYRDSGFDRKALVPGYYKRGQTVIRFDGEYILPENPMFEFDVFEVFQQWLAHKFLGEAETIYEFGCGPAHNLMAFASVYPEKTFHGLDWAKPSQEIIAEIRTHEGFDITGHNFNMFEPDAGPRAVPGATLMTIGAMEQLGGNFGPFADYLFAQDAARYIHVEPILELHDETTLMGYLGAKYMKKRGYLAGYLDRLRERESAGEIEISHCYPVMGSTHYYGWCLIVWTKTG